MGVATEIGEHLSRSAEGRLGIDHPLDLPQFTEPAGEDGRFREVGEIAEKTQLVGREGGAQLIKEQVREQPREDAHRQEEPRATSEPARSVERRTAAGYHAMNMRMMVQVLPPGVEHCDEAGLGAKMLRIGGDRAQRLGRGAEQDGVDCLLVHARVLSNTSFAERQPDFC